jgi:hypothetical protein
MKGLLLAAAFAALATSAHAWDVYHRGYVNRYGTWVAPHYQTAPDHDLYNNYSTYPNINPYTGQRGRIRPYGWPAVNSYTYPRYLPR